MRIKNIFEMGGHCLRLFSVMAVITILLCFLWSKDTMAYDEVVIVIDPGHGGEVTDAQSETNSGAKYHDLMEKDINLVTATALYDELSQYGNVKVFMTRDEDREMTLDERVNYAQEVGADVIVSVHYNASADHNFFGSEIFTSAFGECYATGHGLAQCIMEKWVSNGNTEKDIKTRIGNSGNDYYGLIRHGREMDIPTIILEHAYLDNDKDYLRIKTEDAWKEFGRLDAEGIAKYYGLEKDVVKESVGPTVEVEVPEEPVMPDSTGPSKVDLRIDNYNSNKGDIEFTLYAYDDESKLMYYGFVTDEANDDTVFPELELWTGSNGKLTGTYHIQPGYEGPLTATVFNVYQYNTISNVVKLIADDEAPDEESDNAVKNQEKESEYTDIYLSSDEDVTDTQELNGDNEQEEKIELGGVDQRALDEAMAKAIDESTESTVEKSYNKLLIIGLVVGIVFAVTMVALISSSVNKKKRRRNRQIRERKSYSWIDEDD